MATKVRRLAGKVSVVSPSRGRATNLVGAKYLPFMHYVVSEGEAEQYVEAVGERRVVVCPDEIEGNIGRKRNWILANVERPLVMIDDDVRYLVHEEGGAQQVPLRPEEVRALIIHGFNLAHEWGCVLWGLNVNHDGRNYQQYKPFSLTEMILGPFQAHLEHDLWCDESMDTKDDYDFAIQVLNEHRKILRFNKYAYVCVHGTNEGGIVGGRTRAREEAACERIMAKWGREIIRYKTGAQAQKMGDLLNGRVHVPIGAV